MYEAGERSSLMRRITLGSVAESRRRRSEREKRRYEKLVPLMNNTKWREVFRIITGREIWFQVQLVGWETFSKLIAPPSPGVFDLAPKGWVHPSGFIDGLIGSGFFFREIHRVRCPATVPALLMKSVHDHKQNMAELLEALQSLGRIPISQIETHIEIRGYNELAAGN